METTEEPIAVTTAGRVRGVVDPRTGVRTFRGVPYGATTGGEGRFRAPKPVAPWSGTRDATAYAPPAMQGFFGWTDNVIGTEDCLTLDIVRPNTDEELPVVVYFHGGTFVTGSSHEKVLQGHFLANTTDVVYISVNFRLGVFGYLDFRSLGGDCVANPALLDQILALRWVHDNAANFGGDAGRVTIMGESAGGAGVIHLMCAPAARGLFHRAIAQSPPVASVHSRVQAEMWVRKLLRGMGLPPSTGLAELRAADAEALVRVGQSMLLNRKEIVQFNTSFMPTVDGNTLPAHPIDVFQQGEQAAVPLIIGTNSDEASFAKALYQTNKSRLKAARRALGVYDPAHADAVLATYDHVDGRRKFAALIADAVFWAPSVMLATEHRRKAPTWMYRFEYASATMRRLGLGAMHTSELTAVFGDARATRAAKLDPFPQRADFDEVSAAMQYHWGSFFHNAHPGEKWPIYGFRSDTEPGRATAVFAASSYVEYDPKAAQRRAWEGFDMREWGMHRQDLVDSFTQGLAQDGPV